MFAPLAGQSPAGTLSGVVADARTDSAIAGAVVLLEHTLLSRVTDERGQYRFSGLAPGRYAVRVVAIGYESVTRGDVDVAAGKTRLDLSLERGAIELPGIVVTASRTEERPGESPASVAVLSSDEIARRNVITVDQALRYVPGVSFNGGGGDMDIRGATGIAGGVGSRVLMLLDGHPVLTGDGGEIDFNSLPVLDIDRVEIVKGAYSALYGSNALGGVVNLITTPVGGTPQTVLKAHYGAYDTPAQFRFTPEDLTTQGAGIQHSQRLGPIGTRLFAERETSDGYRQNGQSSRWLVRTKIVSPTWSPHPWDAYAMWSMEDDGEFFTWRSDSQPYQVPAEAVGDWSRAGKLMFGATFSPVATPSARLLVSPSLYHNSIQNHFHDNQDYHRATRVGSNAQLSLGPWSRQALTLGADGARTDVVSNFLGRPVLADLALYAQDEVELSQRLRGSAGARLDYHKAEPGQAEYSFSPKLGFVYRLSPRVSTRASVGHGYRAPSAIEQFVSTTMSGFRVVPNPDLKGEAAWSGEVGVTTSAAGRLWLDAALFQSSYRDLIGPAPAPGQFFVFQFRNVQRARVRGLDLDAKVGVVRDRVRLEATYTYLDPKDLDTGLPLPYRSVHNLTGTLDVLGGLLGLDCRYRSRVEQVLAFPLDSRSAITLVDLRLGYRVLGAIVQAKVANLLQSDYVDVMERNLGPPRNILLTAFRSF